MHPTYHIPQFVLLLSRKVDECMPLPSTVSRRNPSRRDVSSSAWGGGGMGVEGGGGLEVRWGEVVWGEVEVSGLKR